MSAPFLVEALSRVYRSLPRALRKPLLPLAQAAFSKLRRPALILAQVRLTVFRLQGSERSGGRPATVLVFGTKGSWPYIAELVFTRLDKKEELGRVLIGRLPRCLAWQATRPDIVIVHVDKVYRPLLRKWGFVHLPEWVSFRFDLSSPPQQTWRQSRTKNLQENLRRIRKYGYTSVVTHDSAQFDFFYREMYLPFIPRKYGESTELVGPQFMRLFFESGLLLLVKKGEEAISGSIIIAGTAGAKAMIIGMKEGSEAHRREGALAACYYFTTLWAWDKGYPSVDFGECRPFFDDGVFYFKKRWGMRLEEYPHRSNVFGLRVGSASPAALDFLEANPFVVQGKLGLEGRVLAGRDHALTAEEMSGLLRSYLVPGLDCLTIVSPKGFDHAVETTAVNQYAGRVALIHGPAEALFSAWS
jgi:hypothetical protein